jgi:hypothetical protein
MTATNERAEMWPQLADRLPWAGAALEAYRQAKGEDSDDYDTIDLITDLLHHSETHNRDPHAIVRMALIHFEAETEGES